MPKPRERKSHSQKVASEKDRKFAEELLRTGNQAQAARAVGYKGPQARGKGTQMMRKPVVQELVKEAQKAVQAKINYGLEQAMSETEEAMAFAKETENANAFVRAVEHRAKLNGLLVEKHEVRNEGFQLIFGAFGQVPTQTRSIEDDEAELLG